MGLSFFNAMRKRREKEMPEKQAENTDKAQDKTEHREKHVDTKTIKKGK